MTIHQDALYAWCQEHQEEHIALLKELAVIPAPSHQEQQRAAFIRDWLYAAGAREVLLDEACNVILPFGERDAADISVYMAHTDVVFPDTTPLPLAERDGRLFAPGVGDDTANVVALMLCAKYLLTHPVSSKNPVLLVFNSCEEGLGNLKGVRQLMSDYRGRIREVVSFDLTWSTVVSRAVGSERWQVKVRTRGGHSYLDFGSPNAIAHLAGLIGKLYQQLVPQQPGQTTTYNVGTITGGTSVNTIAQEAEMTYEYRSDDRECLASMRAQFHNILDEVRGPEAQFEVTLLGERPCAGAVDQERQEELLRRCTSAVEGVTGAPPKRVSLSTDANMPLSLGIPATTVGLCQGALAHTREEYVEISSLTPGLAVGLKLILPHFD